MRCAQRTCDPCPPTSATGGSARVLRRADGRLMVAGRDAETLAREHGTPLFVVRRHPHGGERARPAGRDGAHGPALEGPLGAQGAARSPGAAPPALHRQTGHAGVRRPRRLLAGRGRARPRARLAGRGDQLHRHQRQRPGPRRAARARRAREPGPHQPDPPLRPAEPRRHHRPARQPARERRPPRQRDRATTAETRRPSSASTPSDSTRPWPWRASTTSPWTRSTST